MQTLGLPSSETVRRRLAAAQDPSMRMCLTATYLCCARISEIVGKPKHAETAYGITGAQVRQVRYRNTDLVVFDVKTAKRQGMLRRCAMPLDDREPLSSALFDYCQQFGKDEQIFDFMRSKVQDYVTRVDPVFQGLTYPIETYSVSTAGQLQKIPGHQRAFRIHALRHARTTELVEKFGFDGLNLAAYGGWQIQTASSWFGATVPKMAARYLYLAWQGYIDKLL